MTAIPVTGIKSPKDLSVRFGFFLGLAGIAAERLLFPLLAADSYQVLLCVVAVGVLYGGLRAGAVALLVSAAAQGLYFVPELTALHAHEHPSVARFILFLSLGLLICALGWRLHLSERRIKYLSGLLPICCSCKRIQDPVGEWEQLEVYIRDHSEAEFTHGLCPQCEAEFLKMMIYR
jgi:succinate-acetate transporter protein